MKFILQIVTAAIVAPLVFAQSNTLGLQAIEAHFKQSELVPDLFASFDPTALVNLTFSTVGVIRPGQNLTKDQAAPAPTVTVTPGNSSTSFSGNYTLALLDAGNVGQQQPEGQTRHWLVNGVTISGSALSFSSAVNITDYTGPGPAAGSGPHRYVFVLYSQPSNFEAPTDLSGPTPISTFVWANYVTNSHLGSLVAATYFTVEEGQATLSISPTSAVVTQTLPAYSSTSGSKVSTSSGTGTGVKSTPTGTSGAIALSSGAFFTLLAFFGAIFCNL